MKTILLTRLLTDNQADRDYFESKGYTTLEIPLITLRRKILEEKILDIIRNSDWIFLTSQHGAEFFIQLQEQIDLKEKKFAVIGEKTGQILLDNDLKINFLSPKPTKRDLFQSWRKKYTIPQTIFYPKSNIADSAGEKEFLAAGYQFETAILYENYFSKESQKYLKQALLTNQIDAVYLASPSLWQRFLTIHKQVETAKMPELFYIGKTTKAAIQKDGFLSE